jgi:hypothetical protein
MSLPTTNRTDKDSLPPNWHGCDNCGKKIGETCNHKKRSDTVACRDWVSKEGALQA